MVMYFSSKSMSISVEMGYSIRALIAYHVGPKKTRRKEKFGWAGDNV